MIWEFPPLQIFPGLAVLCTYSFTPLMAHLRAVQPKSTSCLPGQAGPVHPACDASLLWRSMRDSRPAAPPLPCCQCSDTPTAHSREHQLSRLWGRPILLCFLAQPCHGLPLGHCLSSPSQTLNRQQHLHVYLITEQLSEEAKHILTLLRETETSTSAWEGVTANLTSLFCFDTSESQSPGERPALQC